ncbi:hypothetical protein Acsp05_57270 [Actinokineospora sp. NBRC 105648]|nr:hypothetical protein Acsp05_57270 [Actinokineospora sp. NBRC 105648]
MGFALLRMAFLVPGRRVPTELAVRWRVHRTAGPRAEALIPGVGEDPDTPRPGQQFGWPAVTGSGDVDDRAGHGGPAEQHPAPGIGDNHGLDGVPPALARDEPVPVNGVRRATTHPYPGGTT